MDIEGLCASICLSTLLTTDFSMFVGRFWYEFWTVFDWWCTEDDFRLPHTIVGNCQRWITKHHIPWKFTVS